jgi:DNA-binding transcriptional LysR family regulator
VRVSDAGRALLPEARAALSAVDAARDAVSAVQGGMRGTVHLGIMHSLTLVDLAAVLTRYHQERPRVRIVPHTTLGGSVELIEGVREGRFDVCFSGLPSHEAAGVTVHPLATEPLLFACPDDHPLAGRELIELAELDGEHFVDFPIGWGTRASVDRLFARLGLRREIAVEVTDIPTAVELVRAGFGCAFLSHSLTRGAGALRLRPVRPQPLFEVSLITPADRRISAAAQGLIDLVLATVRRG